MEQTKSTFGLRFNYLRWLRHLIDGEAPSLEEIAAATNRTSVTVGAWRNAENFPDKRGLDVALSRYFGADALWISDGVGEPPQPSLWRMWVIMRSVRHAPATAQDALALLDQKRGRASE